MTIIATHPELLSTGSPKLLSIQSVIAAFLSRRMATPGDALRREVSADVITGTAYAALRHRAVRTDDATPERSLREAMDVLGALNSEPPSGPVARS